MKKAILVILIISALVCSGQVNRSVRPNYYVPDPVSVNKVNITLNQKPGANGWAQNGTTCAGCPSYFFKIFRTSNAIKAEDGILYYYYYFYFFSNSFYSNGNPASTYLSQISFFMNNNFMFKIEYVLLQPGQSIYVAWMRSTSPSASVRFSISKINVH